MIAWMRWTINININICTSWQWPGSIRSDQELHTSYHHRKSISATSQQIDNWLFCMYVILLKSQKTWRGTYVQIQFTNVELIIRGQISCSGKQHIDTHTNQISGIYTIDYVHAYIRRSGFFECTKQQTNPSWSMILTNFVIGLICLIDTFFSLYVYLTCKSQEKCDSSNHAVDWTW